VFKRTITTIIGLPILIFLVYSGGLLTTILSTVAAIMGLRELYTALSGKHKPIHFLGYIFTIIYFAALYLFGSGYTQIITLTIFIIMAQTCLVIFYKKLTLKECIGTIYGFLYIPFLLSFLLLTREHELGQLYVWLIFTSAFGCDTFAYLTGVTIGKHKLTNTPSPNKSVEGLIGGIIGAAFVGGLYGVLMSRFFEAPENFILSAIIISSLAAAFGVVGDMAASAIKRNTGIKDFGNIFPGHGGVLDRIDSIVVAAPIVYLSMNLTFWL